MATLVRPTRRGDAQTPLEPRVFAQYEAYRTPRPGADPYFTPSAPLLFGADLTGRVTSKDRLRVDATLGVVEQGGAVALDRALQPLPRAGVRRLRWLGGASATVCRRRGGVLVLMEISSCRVTASGGFVQKTPGALLDASAS